MSCTRSVCVRVCWGHVTINFFHFRHCLNLQAEAVFSYMQCIPDWTVIFYLKQVTERRKMWKHSTRNTEKKRRNYRGWKKRRNKDDNIKAFGEAGLGEPPRDRMERIACIVFSSLWFSALSNNILLHTHTTTHTYELVHIYSGRSTPALFNLKLELFPSESVFQ